MLRTLHPSLVRSRGRERSRREADTAVRAVEDGVEALQERQAVDEVEALARVRAEVGDDQVDAVLVAADGRVELQLWSHVSTLTKGIEEETYRAGPDLGVRSELVGVVTMLKNRLSRLSN